MKSCLIVVDMQNGFIDNNTKHIVKDVEDLLKSKVFDIVISSKFVNTPTSPCVTITDWDEMFDGSAIDLIPHIEEHSDLIIEKDIYSALNKEVLDLLNKEKIDKVCVIGVNTDCCVLKTVLDLFEANVRPIVLSNYCATTMGYQIHDYSLKILEALIGVHNIVDGKISKEFIDNL